ncbi:MAG: YmdB family metallophosphoesterase [Oscillospiraceae bacterium]|nr:YmdB family metallophosphoesterase [Oscillospiraceae bacterium]
MTANILAIGDITGQVGIDIFSNKFNSIKKWGNIAFTVVNGENAAGIGVTSNQARVLLDVGADVITLGNHTWGKPDIKRFLDDSDSILRPANFAPQVPGRGWGIFDASFGSVCVINLVGRVYMPDDSESPFFEVDRILKQIDTSDTKIILVDFHAEATSEKCAMAYYLDSRVSALWGTHTHVQTSDCRVFSGGMGYITDLGMTGACESIIGMKLEQPISRFLGNPPGRFEPATGSGKVEGAIFEIDTETGRCVSVEAIRVT